MARDDQRSSEGNIPSYSEIPEVLEVLWVGGEGGIEADLVKQAQVPYTTIPAAGVHGVGMRALPGNLWRLSKGYMASRRILRRFKPDVMFFTGGYLAVPMALAGWFPGFGSPRPRTALLVPDIEPGLALRTLSRFADSITVTTKEAQDFFPSHKDVQITGYPTRKDLDMWNLDDARKILGLRDDLKTLLVFGGSRGARSINQALLKALPKLLSVLQIVHISGKANWTEVDSGRLALPSELSERYHPYPYLYAEMGAALTAADLVLSRAGAATMGEFPLFGVPAILVPYPYAWRYQMVNAEYLAEHGAAVVVQDAELEEKFASVVLDLVQNSGRLERMSKAMQSLSQPEAADNIAKILLDLENSTNSKRN